MDLQTRLQNGFALGSKNARVAGWAGGLLKVFHFFVWIANNPAGKVICNL
jgi:hypothetical protein